LACQSGKCAIKPSEAGFTTSVSGTYQGESFGPAYALRMNFQGNSYVVITNRENVCPTSTSVGLNVILMMDLDMNTHIEGGAYMNVMKYADTCESIDTLRQDATLTMWKTETTRYGSFQIPLEGGESLSGTFKTLPGVCDGTFLQQCAGE